MDYWFFQQINAFAGRWPMLDWLGIFLANYLQYFVCAVLLIFLFVDKDSLKKNKNRLMIVLAFLAMIISGFGITAFLRGVIMRPRPFVNYDVVQLIPHAAARSSFPSSHASFFFALATVVYLYNRKIGWGFLAAAALISLARVFVGVHYPSDILAGALVGIFSGWLVYYLFNWQRNKKAR